MNAIRPGILMSESDRLHPFGRLQLPQSRQFHGVIEIQGQYHDPPPGGSLPKMELRPYMTGEAKIERNREPLIIAFTKPTVRFITIEVWSWFP
ncbi:MAG: hypothetical protein WC560_02100 [Syntrophales bacterium]